MAVPDTSRRPHRITTAANNDVSRRGAPRLTEAWGSDISAARRRAKRPLPPSRPPLSGAQLGSLIATGRLRHLFNQQGRRLISVVVANGNHAQGPSFSTCAWDSQRGRGESRLGEGTIVGATEPSTVAFAGSPHFIHSPAHLKGPLPASQRKNQGSCLQMAGFSGQAQNSGTYTSRGGTRGAKSRSTNCRAGRRGCRSSPRLQMQVSLMPRRGASEAATRYCS